MDMDMEMEEPEPEKNEPQLIPEQQFASQYPGG